uniref:Phytosulfokine n=1 Tax=Kalanchoe fedtschenkoi TaxID=63787 RepID=A0A7N0TNU8_KALFE
MQAILSQPRSFYSFTYSNWSSRRKKIMSPKVNLLLLASILLSSLLFTSTARPLRHLSADPTLTATDEAAQMMDHGLDETEQPGCGGSAEEEECLARRTLVAHLDYIYTQKHNNP